MKTLLALLAASPLMALAWPQSAPAPRAGTSEVAPHFYSAIRNNDLSDLAKLIRESGTDARDASGNTPLMIASLCGTADAMRALIAAGADPNAANQTGATPLMLCAGDLEKVKLLLEHGADLKLRSKQGRDALHIAAFYNDDAKTVKLLVQRGADVNGKDAGGSTALEVAAGANNLAAAKLLLAHGANANVADAVGFTPLMAAAGNGRANAAMVKLLVANGASVNAKTADSIAMVPNGPLALGRITALHLAATTDPESVHALVEAGANVDAQDVRGVSPLVFAVATDHPSSAIIRDLLSHGANPAPAIEWAERYNNPAVLALLGRKARPVAAIAVENENAAAVDPLVRSSLQRALAVCQDTAGKFMKTGGCFSCHSQGATGLAVWKSKGTGVPANDALEAGMVQGEYGTADYFSADVAQMLDPGGSYSSVANYLLHLAAADGKPTLSTDVFVHYLCASQRKDGDWPVFGVVRPPLEDGGITCTAKAIRVLRHFAGAANRNEIESRVARAARWLDRQTPTTTEDRAMQILGLIWAGQRPSEARVRQLAALQRPDGGWGQTEGLPSDAYATGETLMTLRTAGMDPSETPYQKGVRFLLRSQEADGSWHVATRALKFQPYFESGFAHGQDQWISQQGTAYAAMALADALGGKLARR